MIRTWKKIHDLKCWPEFYEPVLDGSKPFEVRQFDRDFQVGDILRLNWWDPKVQVYSGRYMYKSITYILAGHKYVAPGYAVLGIGFADLADVRDAQDRMVVYGQYRVSPGETPGKATHAYVHRIAFVLAGGILKDGQVVDHVCEKNARCCNPRHLRAVTANFNNLDGGKKRARMFLGGDPKQLELASQS